MLKQKLSKIQTLSVLASAIIACLGVSPTFAQCPDRAFSIGGSGGSVQFVVCGGGAVLDRAITNDPGPGGLSNVLAYNVFDSLLEPGDVLFEDPGTSTISAVLRFDPGSRAPLFFGATLYVYSLTGLELPDSADIGLPTAFNTSSVTIQRGTNYIPTSGEPGFPNGGTVSYDLVSDAVPEPSAFLLIVSALSVVLLRRWLIGWVRPQQSPPLK